MARESTYDPSGGSQSSRGPDSTATLFSRLIDDTTALVRNEIALARTELSTAANNVKVGAAALAVAAVVLFAGVMALIAAAVLALSKVMEPWAAALIVGVVLAAIGFIMLQTARTKLRATAKPMPRTQNSLHQDAAVIARRVS